MKPYFHKFEVNGYLPNEVYRKHVYIDVTQIVTFREIEANKHTQFKENCTEVTLTDGKSYDLNLTVNQLMPIINRAQLKGREIEPIFRSS